jgi:hypothetical protein
VGEIGINVGLDENSIPGMRRRDVSKAAWPDIDGRLPEIR